MILGDTLDAPTASERPRRRDAQRNHQRVIDAAREVLSEFGDEATMELIAARAGVGVGTVYRHCANKAALFTELVDRIVGDLIVTARRALATRDGMGLDIFLRALGQTFADHRGYADKLMAHADDVANQTLLRLMADLLTNDQRHGTIDPEVTFADVMATVAGLRGVIYSRTGGVVASDELWQRHLAFHLKGLCSP